MNKRFITAQELLEDSFRLAVQIVDSGFRPEFLLVLWRGGAPVGMAIHEYLHFRGMPCEHAVVRVASYTGVGQRATPSLRGLVPLLGELRAVRHLLIVDDVVETGESLAAVISALQQGLEGEPAPSIRVATPWYKPARSPCRRPDYWLYETADWLVFPHELCGISREELRAGKPAIAALVDAPPGE